MKMKKFGSSISINKLLKATQGHALALAAVIWIEDPKLSNDNVIIIIFYFENIAFFHTKLG